MYICIDIQYMYLCVYEIAERGISGAARLRLLLRLVRGPPRHVDDLHVRVVAVRDSAVVRHSGFDADNKPIPPSHSRLINIHPDMQMICTRPREIVRGGDTRVLGSLETAPTPGTTMDSKAVGLQGHLAHNKDPPPGTVLARCCDSRRDHPDV